jgi:very-short-patch-repair endonuclease
VRNRKLGGATFRRQHPISWFIVDFYCHEHKLVVEVDGDTHLLLDVKERDEYRQEQLEALGLKVIRFSNEEVLGELTIVLNQKETDQIINQVKLAVADWQNVANSLGISKTAQRLKARAFQQALP